MSFFSMFPFRSFDLQNNGVNRMITDIFRNVDVNDALIDNITAYRSYYIEDGERPDIVSNKIYGTSDYHWTFFITNDFLKEGLNNWPMNNRELEQFVDKEYGKKSVLTFVPLAIPNQVYNVNTSFDGDSQIINYTKLYNSFSGIPLDEKYLQYIHLNAYNSELTPIASSNIIRYDASTLQLWIERVDDDAFYNENPSFEISRYKLEFVNPYTQADDIGDLTPTVSMIVGGKYMITDPYQADFTEMGAPDNNVGTIFTVTKEITHSALVTGDLSTILYYNGTDTEGYLAGDYDTERQPMIWCSTRPEQGWVSDYIGWNYGGNEFPYRPYDVTLLYYFAGSVDPQYHGYYMTTYEANTSDVISNYRVTNTIEVNGGYPFNMTFDEDIQIQYNLGFAVGFNYGKFAQLEELKAEWNEKILQSLKDTDPGLYYQSVNLREQSPENFSYPILEFIPSNIWKESYNASHSFYKQEDDGSTSSVSYYGLMLDQISNLNYQYNITTLRNINTDYVSYIEKEFQTNESRRNITVIEPTYVSLFEESYKLALNSNV